MDVPPPDQIYPLWYGHVAVVTHAEDPPALLWRLLRDAAACRGGDALVLVTNRAFDHPTCGARLRGVVEHATRKLGARRVWVAADGLGNPGDPHADWLMRLATHVRAELVAPDGPIHLTLDGTRYVGTGAGASGWRSFRPGSDSHLIANRYPTPPWETALPDRPVGLPGLVADPIPAGVLLRASAGSVVDRSDPAFNLPVDRRGPTLVLRQVGEPPVQPDQLAVIFARLPARSMVRIETGLIDPAAEQPGPQWLDRLALVLERSSDNGQVTAGAEPIGRREFAGPPPPAVLRAGWIRVSDRLYRHAVEPKLLSEVTATGILLRVAGTYRRADQAFIDPAAGVLRLDVAASEPLVAALCRTVATAPGELRVDPSLAHSATDRLTAALGSRSADVPGEGFPDKVAPDKVAPGEGVPDRQESDLRYVEQTTAEPVRPATGAPRLTVPLPARVSVPVRPEPAPPPATVPPPTHPLVITSSGPDPELPDDDSSDEIPATVGDSPPAAIELPPTTAGELEPAAPEQSTSGSAEQYVAAAGSPVPDRDSTLQEQREFTAALGPAYTDSITTVNAALAAWPALRQDISAKAKIDLVAVRVFFGRSQLGAARLNAGLRAGQQPELSSYLSCLVSGLRRLPPCRRAMLCQGRLAVPAQQLYSEGTTLVEPGFRSVSGAGLAVQGADVDYLVWSRTARQAGALAERQELDEAVFLAGARFKVLAVREGSPPPSEDVAVPTTAVLLREVLPGEPDISGLDEADRAALNRLERALRRRWSVAPQALTDEEAIDRLAGPPLGYLVQNPETAVAGGPQLRSV
ncbi:hypothetical protein [Micromonospora sp. Llam0]|uniref:hypothetical protein n=1 Tax=Micromonospora sp. Llam0 TaxID=2485143 RepID=UPI000F46E150|nr:hypothetical protein [Micromonospora sp. Llam0]